MSADLHRRVMSGACTRPTERSKGEKSPEGSLPIDTTKPAKAGFQTVLWALVETTSLYLFPFSFFNFLPSF